MSRLLVLSLLSLTVCQKSTSGSATQDLRWDPNREDPSRLFAGADTRLAYNIHYSETGKTFGVEDALVPYPDTYWPFVEDGIDVNWTHTQSPLEKYMQQVDPSRLAQAKAWEKNNHGSAVPGVAKWWGHCPGWTAAAIVSAPVRRPVYARYVGSAFQPCEEGSADCTKFEIGDVNALMAEIFVDAESKFIGARCDTKPTDIQRDDDDRILKAGCRGLNAGSLVVVLGNILRGENRALALNAQDDGNTDQIWNQPAYRYTLYGMQPLSKDEATETVRGQPGDYKWNLDAKGFVFVDIGIWWVTERGPNRTVETGLSSSREMRFTAVLELDGDPTDLSTRIIGGEYVDDPSVGSTRLKVPPFMWTALGPGRENLPLDVGGNYHNPYVSPSLVQQLADLGK